MAFVYDLASFKEQRRFTYAGEGWGLTHDGTRLIGSTKELARLANDGMAEIVAQHPDLFPCFVASLPMNNVAASLEEVDDSRAAQVTSSVLASIARTASRHVIIDLTGVPTLGICLGHQLSAVALGGRVDRNPRGQQIGVLDVGWRPAAAADPLFARVSTPARAAPAR